LTEGLETMTFPFVRTSITRRAGAAAAVVALALALGACSSSAKPGVTGSTTPTDAKTTAALLQRGLQEQVAGDLTNAEKDFKVVISRDPKNKYAFYNLGLIYQTQAKNSAGESEYRLALSIDPKFGPALYNLGILRTLAKDIPGAIDLYRRAIASNAKDANAHYNLGLLLRGQGKTGEGNQEVQTAVNLEPSLRAKALKEGVPLTGS
jgi:Tfp pilus assembly protein PilF